MIKQAVTIYLIFLFFIAAIVSACYKLSSVGFIIVLIIIAIIMYVLSPYLKKLNINCHYTASSECNSAEIKFQGNKETKTQIATSSYGPSKIELRLGYGLIGFAEGYYDGQLTVLTAKLRNKTIRDYKFTLPPVGLHEDNLLAENEYKIRICGQEVFQGFVNNNADEIIINLERCVLENIDKFR